MSARAAADGRGDRTRALLRDRRCVRDSARSPSSPPISRTRCPPTAPREIRWCTRRARPAARRASPPRFSGLSPEDDAARRAIIATQIDIPVGDGVHLVQGPAVPLGAARVLDDRAAPRQHRRPHGQVVGRDDARAVRSLPGHEHADGARRCSTACSRCPRTFARRRRSPRSVPCSTPRRRARWT